jgi:hypothetical protein
MARGQGLKIALPLCPVTEVVADNQSRHLFAEGYLPECPLMRWAGTQYLPPGVRWMELDTIVHLGNERVRLRNHDPYHAHPAAAMSNVGPRTRH